MSITNSSKPLPNTQLQSQARRERARHRDKGTVPLRTTVNTAGKKFSTFRVAPEFSLDGVNASAYFDTIKLTLEFSRIRELNGLRAEFKRSLKLRGRQTKHKFRFHCCTEGTKGFVFRLTIHDVEPADLFQAETLAHLSRPFSIYRMDWAVDFKPRDTAALPSLYHGLAMTLCCPAIDIQKPGAMPRQFFDYEIKLPKEKNKHFLGLRHTANDWDLNDYCHTFVPIGSGTTYYGSKSCPVYAKVYRKVKDRAGKVALDEASQFIRVELTFQGSALDDIGCTTLADFRKLRSTRLSKYFRFENAAVQMMNDPEHPWRKTKEKMLYPIIASCAAIFKERKQKQGHWGFVNGVPRKRPTPKGYGTLADSDTNKKVGEALRKLFKGEEWEGFFLHS